MNLDAIRMRTTAQANPRTEAEIDRRDLLEAYDELVAKLKAKAATAKPKK